jgi:hypothetical protein
MKQLIQPVLRLAQHYGFHLGLPLLLLALLSTPSAWAQSSIYEGYVVLNLNGAGNTYYDLTPPGPNTVNPDFTGNLGTFTTTQTLVLNGAQLKTVKNTATDNVTGARLQYRVYTGAASGAFTAINLPFDANIGGAGPGFQNQQWTNASNGLNLIAGLPVGSYTLEVYGEATTTPSGLVYFSNGGANYKVTFTVASQQSSFTESFEVGTLGSFSAANGTATNKWQPGITAGGAASASSAYISNSGSAPFAYNYVSTSSTVHLYRTVVIPAGESIISLSFSWKGDGESTNDYLRVSYAPSTFLPTANNSSTNPGTPITGSGAGTPSIVLDNLQGQGNTFTTATATLPASLAGTTIRLIFTWTNDNATRNTPPAAIDNVVLTSRAPLLLNGVYTINSSLLTTGRNFQTWTAAITALNEGISGPVTFNVSAGQTFSEASQTITTTGTAANPIVFQTTTPGTPATLRGTTGTGTADAILRLAGADYLTFDGINLLDNPTNGSSTTRMERGLFLDGSGSASNGCQNVTFKNGTVQLNLNNNNVTTGIYSGSIASSLAGTNSNNTFLNVTVQNATQGYQLLGATANPDENNLIDAVSGTSLITTLDDNAGPVVGVGISAQKNLQIKNTTFQNFTANSTLYGIGGTTAACGFTISGNKFSKLVSSGGTVAAAIYVTVSSAALPMTVNNNQIQPIAPDVVAVSSSSSAVALYGIRISTGSASIYDNLINTLTQTSGVGTGQNIVGIDVGGSTHSIYRNAIHTLTQATASGGAISGILATGTAVTIYNNLLANLRYNGINGSPGVRAMSVGATNSTVYYNSVYLSGTATTSSHQSAALYISSGTVDYRNNILFNDYKYTTGGTPRAVAVWLNGGSVAASSNNNLVHGSSAVGTPALSCTGTAGSQQATLAGYRTQIGGGGRESQAFTESSPAIFTSSTNPHLSGTATQAENGAVRITTPLAIDQDYDLTLRQGETGYAGTGSAPDIGADEGNFTLLDLTAPTIAYTALANTTSFANRTLAVTITDLSGIGSGANLPRLYYRKGSSGGFTVAAAPTVAGNVYTFTIDHSAVGGVTGYDNIYYYLAAQDQAATPNVGTAPTGGSGINPPGTTAPATFEQYLITPVFSGPLNVGPTEAIKSLTAAGGLFDQLNIGVVTGALTVLITGNLTVEDGSTALNPLNQGGTNYAVSLQPDGTTERLVTGAANSMGNGIVLNGADNVTFDGRFNQTGSTKYLRFRNASASQPVFTVRQDATGNTFRDAYVEGGTTSTGNAVVFIGNSTAAAVGGVTGGVSGNDNTAVLSCDIFRAAAAANLPAQAIFSPTPSVAAAAPDNVTISGNNIYNWSAAGLITAGAGSGWIISSNSFYQTASSTATSQTALSLGAASSATGWVVGGGNGNGNYIGGSAPLAGSGAWVNTAAVTFRGIYLNGLGTGAVATTVQNNTIANVQLTTSANSTFAGIEVSNSATTYQLLDNIIDNVRGAGTNNTGANDPVLVGIVTSSSASSANQLISGNTISRLALTGTANNVWSAGILMQGSGDGTASRNRIYGCTTASTSATAGGPIGIEVSDGNWTIANSQISFLAPSPTNASIRCYGLLNGASFQTERFYFNSVLLGGTISSGSQKTYAFAQTGFLNGLTLRNNVFVNLRSGGSGGQFAIATANAFGLSSNNSDLFAADATKLGEVNTTAYNFTSWKANSNNGDGASVTVPVRFVDTATGNLNLDPSTNCKLDNTGVAIAGINGEYDLAATSRQTTPDMGADEFSFAPPTTGFASTAALCGSGPLTVNSAGGNGLFTIAYSIGGVAQTPILNASATQALSIPAQTAAAFTNVVLTKVTDSYGCDLSIAAPASTVVVERLPTFTTAKANVGCFGGSSGSCTVTAGTGLGTFEYSKDGGANYQPSNTFSGLAVGTYSILVRNLSGSQCTALAPQPVTITEPAAALACTTVQLHVSCYGGNSGSCTVNATGGTTPYQYSLNGATAVPGNVFSNLTAGTYTIDVADANACTVVQQTVTITEPTELLLTATPTNATCSSGSDGSIAASGSGGTDTYQYNLNNGAYQASGSFPGLAPGLYLVGVKDANTCTTVQNNVSVGSLYPAPTASLSNSGPVCGGSGATATLTLGGSAGPWTFTYTVNGLNPQLVSTGTSPYLITLPVPLAANQTVALTALSDDLPGCLAASLPSTTVVVTTLTTWTGTMGDSWTDPGNWNTGCVPNQYISAMIPAGMGTYPNQTTGNTTAAARNLTIAPAATVVFSSGTFELYGNLANSGTLSLVDLGNTPNTGADLRLRGTTQTLGGLPDVYDLTVDAGGTATLSGTGTFKVYHALTMTAGLLNTGARTAQLHNRTAAAFADATLVETDLSYLLGSVSALQDVSTPGAARSFGGIGLVLTPHASATTLPGSTLAIRYTGTALTGTMSRSGATRWFRIQPTVDANLHLSLACGYFDHERNGITNPNMMLFSTPGTLNPAPNGPWAAHNSGAVTAPVGTAAGDVTVGGLTHLSDWTLGNRAEPLPVELSRFEARRQDNNAELSWTTASEKDNRGFEVQVSTDGREFRPLHFLPPASPNSSTPRSYGYTDREAGKQGLRYYRLRQLDLNGLAHASVVRTLAFDLPVETQCRVQPNPFRTELTLTVQTAQAQPTAPLSLTNAAGQQVWKLVADLPAGFSQLPLHDLERLPQGVYILHVPLKSQTQHLKVVKY